MPLQIKKTPGSKASVKAEGQASISTQKKEKGEVMAETASQETVPHPSKTTIEGAPCTVGFGASFTKNLGNYQSAKVEVHLSIPCAHDEIDTVFDYAKNWVDAKMEQELGDDE